MKALKDWVELWYPVRKTVRFESAVANKDAVIPDRFFALLDGLYHCDPFSGKE